MPGVRRPRCVLADANKRMLRLVAHQYLSGLYYIISAAGEVPLARMALVALLWHASHWCLAFGVSQHPAFM